MRGLYAITACDGRDTRTIIDACSAALRGGAGMLQYRDKHADPALRRQRARALQALCRAGQALFIVNDDLELALALAADGLHIGADDGDVRTIRQAMPADMLLGVSCYNQLSRAAHAADSGADYLAFGAMYPSKSKPGACAASPSLLAQARQFGLPVVAIGGITTDNAAPLLRSGADAIAVINGLFASGTPNAIEQSARRFAQLFEHQEMSVSQSEQLFAQSQNHIPGGVNSPVRAFRGVGGNPVFIDSAQGAWLTDVDGKRYVDYVCSWGPMLRGHAHPDVLAAIGAQMQRGLGYGAPTEIELRMAERLQALVPSLEQVRMVNSGTEATMSAIRLARGFTGRDRILKFEGCYHGHADGLLVNAGSGALTLGVPSSPGVPAEYAKLTLTATYNDLASARALFAEQGAEIACIIVEPVAGNMNCIPPAAGFLQGLRALCDEYGSLLIFDEVMTGFRVASGGAQARYGVQPDLTTLGKVIGGGMPVGAFGGRRDIMNHLAPVGPVYQAGTLSGNPVAMAAGLATLSVVDEPDFQQDLEQTAATLTSELQALADAAGIAFTTNQVGSMFGLFFTDASEVSTYQQVMACDTERFARFFHEMLDAGVYLAPSAFEAGFVSAAHGSAEIEHTLRAAKAAFSAIR